MITLGRVGTTIEDRLILGDVSVLEDMYGGSGKLLYAIAGVLDPDNKDRITAAVFSDAWDNRRDFDPSRGSVRAWLVRQARLSYPMGPESDRRVDELVVAATVSDMDDVQRQILVEGSSASGRTEDLAEHLDLPVGTVEGHLRRGIRTLQSELVDGRLDGDDSRLADIIRSGRLESDLASPPDTVWRQIMEMTGADETVPMEASALEPEPVGDLDIDDELGELDGQDKDELDALADGESDDSGGPGTGRGLVDEFSATDFPGQTPLQPEMTVAESDVESESELESESDHSHSEVENESVLANSDEPEIPVWSDLDIDADSEADAAGEATETDADLVDPVDVDGEVDDDGVPYVLSGRYRPGVDDDPYVDRPASGGSVVSESSASESTDVGDVLAAVQDDPDESAQRRAEAEAIYFNDDEDAAKGTGLAALPWPRIIVLAVAAFILLGIVLTLR